MSRGGSHLGRAAVALLLSGGKAQGATPQYLRAVAFWPKCPARCKGRLHTPPTATGKWLTVVVHANGVLRLISGHCVRVMQITIPDARINPDGWRLVYLAMQLPAAPMFFNASGTEGQMIVGSSVANPSDAREVASGGGGTATVETIDALGSGESDDLFSINIGTAIWCMECRSRIFAR